MRTSKGTEQTAQSAADKAQQLLDRLDGRQLVVFLDYDGTLSPIAPRPELAVLPDATRQVLGDLAERWTTAIISGRALADARELVGLDNIIYAGNHGLEIEGPAASGISRNLADDYRDDVSSACEHIERVLNDVPGVLVENKVFSLSVHYRLVADEDVTRVTDAVTSTLEACPRLVRHDGKKVYELRPAIDWNKGRAVTWLHEILQERGGDAYPAYVGDDVTDEDAFRALAGVGVGILVSDTERPTAATWRLRDTDEVREFLARLAEDPKR